jgi:hypothetical protein
MRTPEEQVRIGSSSASGSIFQAIIFFLIIFLNAAEGTPGINESHYIPKAKHLWDSDFAPGDLFLQSHDTHFLASAMAGLAAQFISLDAVAWLGRTISWGLLAWGWLVLCQSLRFPVALRPFALATWLLGVHYGNWAGEWGVGGFEAKTIAYPLVLFGLAAVVARNWAWVWLAMGGAMAWHPVVGGWAGLSAGIAWLAQGQLRTELPKQLPWLIAGAAVALVGVIPAASGLGGPDVIDKVSAAQVHVFMRLPHHLSPQLFAPQRHWAAACTLAIFTLATVLLGSGTKRRHVTQGDDCNRHDGLRRLLICSWLAALFSLIGLAIDWSLSVPRPDIAAKLLRFYWFRWSDIVLPLVSSLIIWNWLASALAPLANASNSSVSKPQPWLKRGLLPVAILATVFAVGSRLQLSEQRLIPPADRLLVESVGRNAIVTDRYVDWLAVCQWIREHTPQDSLWLTPKYQQSFKWHARRAEVVCWKDVPQDNASVIEWYHRIENCDPPRDSQGRIRDWTTEELLKLAAQYGARWILLDRTYQSQPPALEIKYPVTENGTFIENRSFVVMHIPDALQSQGLK